MISLKFLKIENVFLSLVLCGVVIILLRNQSGRFRSDSIHDKTTVRPQSENICPIYDPALSIKVLFRDHFSFLNDSSWQKREATYAPTFKELHGLLFGPAMPNLYNSWPNFFKKSADDTYPHTSLIQPLFAEIISQIDYPIRFVVEIGSFMGKSANNICKTLLNKRKETEFVLLCIDTWLGGREHWVQSDLRNLMGVAYGRPLVYEQFIANVIANNLTKYILPFSTTSILGARILLERKLFPQVIFLDSAHLKGETLLELELYWSLLQNGGILIGDDWSWVAVRTDVEKFVQVNKLKITVKGNIWFIKKN